MISAGSAASGTAGHRRAALEQGRPAAPLALASVAAALSLLRALIVPRVPQSWDAVQYILAVREFDLEKHQPHPPGYYLHVKSAALLRSLGLGDADALYVLSLLAGAGLVGLIVWWVAEQSGPRAGVVAAVLSVFSPLVCQAATDARTYMTGALGASVVGYLSWRIAQGDRRWLLLSGILLGVTAGFRPTAAMFIAPVWLWAILCAGWRSALTAGVGALFAVAAWAVPFMVEVGGLSRYLEISGRLGELVMEHTPIGGGGLAALRTNATRVGYGLLMLGGVGLVGLWRGVRLPIARPPAWLLLWLLPPLAFFLLVHTGPPLYVMIVAAPLLAVGAGGLSAMLLEGASGTGRGAFLIAVVLLHAWLTWAGVVVPRLRADAQFLQLARALEPIADEHTVALTTMGDQPQARGGYVPFRHAGYLLPNAHVYLFPLEMLGAAGTMPNYAHTLTTGLAAPPVSHPNATRLLLLGAGMRQYLPEGRRARLVYDAPAFAVYCVDLAPDEVLRLGANGNLILETEG